MKIVELTFIFALTFFTDKTFSQAEGLILGGSYNDEAFSIFTDSEDNFYLAATERAFENDYEKVSFYKNDKNGNTIFKKLYGEGYRNRPFDLIQLNDGNFLICGESWGGFGSIYGRRNVFLLKVTPKGKELWSENYYLYHRDQAFSVKELNSGDFLVIGYSKSFENGNSSIGDVYLLKTDKNGLKLWEKSYNSEGNDYGFDFVEKDNGNYLLLCNSGGFFNSNQADYRYSHDAEIMLIETDTDGNEIDRKFWGTEKHDFGRKILKAPNGDGYYIVGSTQSYGNGSFDMLLLKVDDNGNEEWYRTYGKSNFDYGISLDITESEDNVYLCGTTYDDFSETTKISLIKTDIFGNEIWSHEIGNEELFLGQSVKSLNDGGCVVVGTTKSCSLNNTNNIFIQRFDKNGNIKFNSNELIGINIFPNPVMRDDKITFELTLNCSNNLNNTIEVYDINSKLIQKSSFNNNSWSFFPTNLKSGIYFYKFMKSDSTKLSGKFIVH